jgi:hypothetical protein
MLFRSENHMALGLAEEGAHTVNREFGLCLPDFHSM